MAPPTTKRSQQSEPSLCSLSLGGIVRAHGQSQRRSIVCTGHGASWLLVGEWALRWARATSICPRARGCASYLARPCRCGQAPGIHRGPCFLLADLLRLACWCCRPQRRPHCFGFGGLAWARGGLKTNFRLRGQHTAIAVAARHATRGRESSGPAPGVPSMRLAMRARPCSSDFSTAASATRAAACSTTYSPACRAPTCATHSAPKGAHYLKIIGGLQM